MSKCITSEPYPIGTTLSWLARKNVNDAIIFGDDDMYFEGWTTGGGRQYDSNYPQYLTVKVPSKEIWAVNFDAALQLKSMGGGPNDQGYFTLHTYDPQTGESVHICSSRPINTERKRGFTLNMNSTVYLSAGTWRIRLLYTWTKNSDALRMYIPGNEEKTSSYDVAYNYKMDTCELASMSAKLVNKRRSDTL